jgi:hypothetical protein
MRKPDSGTYEYTRDSDRLPICWEYPDNQCLPHFHSSLELIYVRAGEMKATLDGRTHPVRAGQVASCRPTLFIILPRKQLPTRWF